MNQLDQALSRLPGQTLDFISNLNWQYPSCVAGKMGTWGAAGTAVGAGSGLALSAPTGGTAAPALVPAGVVLVGGGGAVAGGVSGLITCSHGSGPTSGGESIASDRPKGVPEHWKKVPDKKGKGGFKYVDPSSPEYNYVRVRADGTITQVKNGAALDVNGNPVRMKTSDAHFPAYQFVFRP
jgi:hypothetical protein